MAQMPGEPAPTLSLSEPHPVESQPLASVVAAEHENQRNTIGLMLVWFLVGARFSTSVWLINIVVTLFVIDAGFWFLNPELYWYVGLSGLLHGLLAAGIIAKLGAIDVETVVLALLLIGKLIWEQVGGPMPGSELTSGGPVVVDAHLYGTLGGIAAALLVRIRR